MTDQRPESPGIRIIRVSEELLAELGEWSEPVQVKVVRSTDEELELIFRRAE